MWEVAVQRSALEQARLHPGRLEPPPRVNQRLADHDVDVARRAHEAVGVAAESSPRIFNSAAAARTNFPAATCPPSARPTRAARRSRRSVRFRRLSWDHEARYPCGGRDCPAEGLLWRGPKRVQSRLREISVLSPEHLGGLRLTLIVKHTTLYQC